ncbi:DNA helicase RecQ [Limosilactobacillus kribbianus]|uniref:DNA helicase RecQ n=1 Tax=Limosilactobacillus kribbianus TaxID=2982695 RepID=UPI0022643F2B|nr:DNA helicase RecQ [Limosilactobacillus kribbianus]
MTNCPLAVLQKHFGFEHFRPGQERVIDQVLAGQNTLAVMPTGGGKSLCYQIPALISSGVTIVVSPLISLMKDQVDALRQNGIRAGALNSTTPREEVNPLLRSAYNGETKLLYVTPERLAMDYFQYQLSFINISLVAIDEAHCISQWGHDFRPAYRQLNAAVTKLPSHPVALALTATATPRVQEDIGTQLSIPQQNFVITSFTRPNISFRVVHPLTSTRQVIAAYLKDHQGEAGIIYANTRKRVESLTKYLAERGFNVAMYHAGMTNEDRTRVQDDFQYDRIPVIVATNAFGMGIDKSNVRFVLHATSAKNLESYYQEAGRAGRDGLPSEAIMYYHANDIQQYRRFIDQSTADDEYREVQYKKLQAVTDYANTPQCLQQQIVEYFGQECESCGHCSNCTDSREVEDVTVAAKVLIAVVDELHGRFGKSLVVKVATGSHDQRIKQLGADELEYFDGLEKYSQAAAGSLLDYLVATGFLEMDGGQYPIVKVSQKGRQVLAGMAQVSRRVEPRSQKKATQIEETPEEAELFQALRLKRRELASEQKVPPFVVFSDRALHEMARLKPQTADDFLAVNGVGQVKLKRYGDVMMKVIKEQYKENTSTAD